MALRELHQKPMMHLPEALLKIAPLLLGARRCVELAAQLRKRFGRCSLAALARPLQLLAQVGQGDLPHDRVERERPFVEIQQEASEENGAQFICLVPGPTKPLQSLALEAAAMDREAPELALMCRVEMGHGPLQEVAFQGFEEVARDIAVSHSPEARIALDHGQDRVLDRADVGRCEQLEEALLLLESVDDPTPEEARLVANLRTSYARRLLTRVPKLKSVSFEVWLFYFNVLVRLAGEVEALTTADPTLAANRHEFVAMWGPEVLAAIEKGNAV